MVQAPHINRVNVQKFCRQNFEQGFEREGAHLAIYYKGRQVVNVWNGFSDSESQRKWTMRTKTVFYSATKVSVVDASLNLSNI